MISEEILNHNPYDIDFIVDLVFDIISILQNQQLHGKRILMEEKLHKEEIHLENLLHQENIRMEKEMHLMNIIADLEMHFQQLNADLLSSSRESERDMFDQRSQQFQTLGVAATIMLNALITVLIQGNLIVPVISNYYYCRLVDPSNDGGCASNAIQPTIDDEHWSVTITQAESIYLTYALSNSLSLGFLVICIVLCTEIVLKAASFIYKRSDEYSKTLNEAVGHTKTMMKQIRGSNYSSRHFNSVRGISPLPKNIVDMDDETINEEWLLHEKKILGYIEHRDNLHNQLIDNMFSNGTKNIQDFGTYWLENFEDKSIMAIRCFYIGTLLMITANVVFMWVNFLIMFDSKAAAVIAVAILGFSGTSGMIIVIYLRYYKHMIEKYNKATFVNDDDLLNSSFHSHRSSNIDISKLSNPSLNPNPSPSPSPSSSLDYGSFERQESTLSHLTSVSMK